MEAIVNALIQSAAQVLAALAAALIGIAGTWLSARIGKYHSLKTIRAAVEEARDAAGLTVLELQQTTVEGLKAASADGKLTQQEIAGLRQTLLDKTQEKLSAVSAQILAAAGVDLAGLITGTAEALLTQMKTAPDAKSE